MSTTHDTPRTTHDTDSVRAAVRTHYAAVVEGGRSCCGSESPPVSLSIGYDESDLAAVPAGADLGLGCGNPQAIAALRPGETVLDLGCGAGFDVFLAARAVGPTGHVIGVDMTPEMLTRARANAAAGAIDNVDFRLGEIEHLPLADASVDVVISNCVVNLSPEQQQVLDEAHRVLRPGGRLAISDVVTSAELPAEVRADLDLVAACVTGASTIDTVIAMLERAGFTDVRVVPDDPTREMPTVWDPARDVGDYVVAASIRGTRPA
jgi:SAM-dependent methyltransferase